MRRRIMLVIARRAYAQGRADQRAADVAFLYDQAEIHRGRPSDAKRRGALHHAADRLRDGHGVGRPTEHVEAELEREPRPLGWLFRPQEAFRG